MAADLGLQGRKTFKVFNQDFIVDERYVVTKELGQGAYGIVWYVSNHFIPDCTSNNRAWLIPMLVLRRTNKLKKGSRSRRLQMFSARRFLPSVLSERSSFYSTFGAIATYDTSSVAWPLFDADTHL
jgi:hypothetical protein